MRSCIQTVKLCGKNLLSLPIIKVESNIRQRLRMNEVNQLVKPRLDKCWLPKADQLVRIQH